MSFEDQEVSLDSGQPAFLFAFSREGRAWRYTNAGRDIVYGGNTYTATPVVDSGIAQESGTSSDEYRLTVPASIPLCVYLDAVNTSFPITLFVYKVHLTMGAGGLYNEPEASSAKLMWAGNLAGVGRPAINQRELTLYTSASSLKRGGLRLSWGRSCPHMLYGRGCLVNKASFATVMNSPSVVDGVQIQSTALDALADGWFSGGFVEWQYESGLIERTAVESHVGAVLTLLGTTQGMQHAIDGGMTFTAYAGCDRTPDTCDTKFSNILNFGGIEFLQGKSPFSGQPIF